MTGLDLDPEFDDEELAVLYDCGPDWDEPTERPVHDLPDISEWNDMKDHDDRHRDLYERPLARAHALADQWTGDLTSITRSEAAELLYTVLDSRGWTETKETAPALTLVSDDGSSS